MVSYEFDELTANDVLDEIDGLVIWILNLSKDEHLGNDSSGSAGVSVGHTYHLGYFLGVLVVSLSIGAFDGLTWEGGCGGDGDGGCCSGGDGCGGERV